MLEFIKMFGMGIVYTVLSPLILLYFLLFVVYSIGNYLVCEAINLSGFFFGKRFSDKTELEKVLEVRKNEAKEQVANKDDEVETINAIKDEGGDLHA